MTVGLTGGIAAGKSTVREMLAARCSVSSFDADACVHRLLDEDKGVATAISRDFGDSFLRPGARPDRSALRELVFRDAVARRRLEAILHPLVRAEWLAVHQRCLSNGTHFLADIPLLYETKADKFFDVAVVVACSPEMQLTRLRDRGIEPKTAQAMLASQLPLGQKVGRATFVIWNDGSRAALDRQIELVAHQLFHD